MPHVKTFTTNKILVSIEYYYKVDISFKLVNKIKSDGVRLTDFTDQTVPATVDKIRIGGAEIKNGLVEMSGRDFGDIAFVVSKLDTFYFDATSVMDAHYALALD